MSLFFCGKYFASMRKTSYHWGNKSKFVSLKRILPILAIIVLTVTQTRAQDNRSPLPDGPAITALSLYPNPANSYITFDLKKGYQKGLTITVYNFLGKKMTETPNVNEKTTLQLNDFNRGVYIYHLTDPSGKVIDTGKFQVSK